MREFVCGSDRQFDMLKKSLNDENCHVYDCVFPSRFSVQGGRLGFEKDKISYILYIDKGLKCSGRAPQLVKRWLESGSLRFLDFSDMKEFLKSLSFLYPELGAEVEGANE